MHKEHQEKHLIMLIIPYFIKGVDLKHDVFRGDEEITYHSNRMK